MLRIHLKNGKEYDLKAIPLASGNEFFPGGAVWGEYTEVKGILTSPVSTRELGKGGLFELESTGGNYILIKETLVGIDELVAFGGAGVKVLLTFERKLIDFSNCPKVPYIFYINPLDLGDCTALSGEEATVIIDLTAFKKVECESWGTLVYDTSYDVNLLKRRIEKTIQEISMLYGVKLPAKISVYYFQDDRQRGVFSSISEGFAYRDKFVGLVYKKGNYSSEAHELTHLALSQMGNPVFLLEEGLAMLTYDLLTIPDYCNKFLCNIMSRNLKRKQMLKELDYLISPVKSNRIYDMSSYLMAASFLSWIYSSFGMKTVLRCYRAMSRENTLAENHAEFLSITQLSFYEAEKAWLNELERVIGLQKTP